MTTNLDLCNQFWAKLGAADIPGLMAMIGPDFVLDSPPVLPYGGQRKGPDGFVAMLKDLNQHYALVVHHYEAVDAGPFVVATIDAEFTSRVTGRSARLPIVELWTVENGLIVRADIYYKNPGAVTAAISADG